MNNLIIIAIAVALFIVLVYTQSEHLYGDIIGNKQRWMKMQHDSMLCDTDYNDDNCKFVALNCSGNQGSLFVDDKF